MDQRMFSLNKKNKYGNHASRLFTDLKSSSTRKQSLEEVPSAEDIYMKKNSASISALRQFGGDLTYDTPKRGGRGLVRKAEIDSLLKRESVNQSSLTSGKASAMTIADGRINQDRLPSLDSQSRERDAHNEIDINMH